MIVPKDRDTLGRIEPLPRAWIFQANPVRYRILESLATESAEFWNLRQHAREVQIGDRVLIWLSGIAAGIYALGTVVTSPQVMPDLPPGSARWTDPSEGRRPLPRVLVRYDRRLLDRPLQKPILQAIPDLWELAILQSPRGTNFPVTEAEWMVISAWLDVPM